MQGMSRNRRRNKVNRWPEIDLQLTRVWPAVDQRLTSGTKSALCSWMPTSRPTPLWLCTCRIQNRDIPRPVRVVEPGEAGSRKIGCQQNYSPGKQRSIVLFKASKTRRFNVSREARTSEILCKPTEEPNQRLTSGLSAVHQRFSSRARSALCSWLPTSGTTPFFVPVNPLHARHVREKPSHPKDVREQNWWGGLLSDSCSTATTSITRWKCATKLKRRLLVRQNKKNAIMEKYMWHWLWHEQMCEKISARFLK